MHDWTTELLTDHLGPKSCLSPSMAGSARSLHQLLSQFLRE